MCRLWHLFELILLDSVDSRLLSRRILFVGGSHTVVIALQQWLTHAIERTLTFTVYLGEGGFLLPGGKII